MMAAIFYVLLLLSAVCSSCRAEEPGTQAALDDLESTATNAYPSEGDAATTIKGQFAELESLIGVSIMNAGLNKQNFHINNINIIKRMLILNSTTELQIDNRTFFGGMKKSYIVFRNVTKWLQTTIVNPL